jgi:hypothetical protein
LDNPWNKGLRKGKNDRACYRHNGPKELKTDEQIVLRLDFCQQRSSMIIITKMSDKSAAIGVDVSSGPDAKVVPERPTAGTPRY